ncbi:hypothetical protein HPB49_010282 [Dermacentor silvarum]|uniref:Uncharacterized protein n=1 Tax=Dermacentor silvarum TaxID=543639 RepID=A0ACB8D4L8_DERSI|nr:hypothetical protein HPB49_010282 [Dermacentor silvarum]
MRQIRGAARITDWSAFRTTPFPLLPSPQDYKAWASYALHIHQSYTRCICTSTSAPAVDPHLLHLWEARHSLTRRWRRYKLNRKLRSRIQALTAEAADYFAQLAGTNWVDTCMKAAGQMSAKSTWRLFRSLLDPSTTRGETQRQLRRACYAYQGPTSQLANDLCDRYLCRTVDPKGPDQRALRKGAPRVLYDASQFQIQRKLQHVHVAPIAQETGPSVNRRVSVSLRTVGELGPHKARG